MRDEGERYGQKLIESGVKVTMKRYNGMIHLFYAMTDMFEDGHEVYELINSELRALEQRTV
ncbi:acetyl esterase/lipase [Paenibacillus aceris]|uniref:Acetyl esterase/lipase n=1 Tax=Paenibacillus aceris TaxID=869555 RepID=A0ABS4HW00_9BACL|nr:acetyl esterase/lipase [Paenibacillus aceris]